MTIEEAIVMMKGKRTKRLRPFSPLAIATADGESIPTGDYNFSDESLEMTRPTTDTNEDEDLAHCLILLAQGSKSKSNSSKELVSMKYKNGSNASSYECKTCSKSFPSFQALGGHRASHKKPKLGITDHHTKKSSIFSLFGSQDQAHKLLHDHYQLDEDEIALSLHIDTNNYSNNKAKVHECGICGAEFSSGQALGGHMRRHRPIGGSIATSSVPSSSQSASLISGSPNNTNRDTLEIKTRNFLSLDLNLPATDNDHQQQQERDIAKFVFPSNGKTLVFSTSSLVDCLH